ncbi:MAG: isoaspartyl peptidase/L-asparaginase [Planctomycetes bacterium]|nr:isoaspartyl peptidase/L-asparaginase [Planctomycetota bacterium]
MARRLTRRSFLKASAVTATVSCANVSTGRRGGPVAVSSRNGLPSLALVVERMEAGLPPVDAAVLGVEPVENDPEDMSVGYGGLPDETGVVTLDSCVMDGPSGLAGAVAALENIKNPAQVALKVMRRTDHVLLVGEGALRFARAHGFPEQNLLTDRARESWLRWKERGSQTDDWIDPADNGEYGKEWIERPTGTIHIGARNAAGDLGGCTTTSGLAFKIRGRVGDSPLIGCGNYVDNDYGVAGSTGRGEAAIVTNGASRTVQYMALGKSPVDACLETVRDVARMTRVPRLLDDKGRPNFQVNFYAIDKQGIVGSASMRPSTYARFTENGPELADTAALFD